MTSREIILRNLNYDDAPRIGYHFHSAEREHPSDIADTICVSLVNPNYPVIPWGRDAELAAQVPDFQGELRRDHFGNIMGRLNSKTGGECLKGALDDWADLASYTVPQPDPAHQQKMQAFCAAHPNKFRMGFLPISVFSSARDLRRMDNVLADIILEKENLTELLQRVLKVLKQCVRFAGEAGFDGLFMCDDWGIQDRLFIHPKHWVEIFKPIYAELFAETHKYGMRFFLHSCGYVYPIMNDLIDAGVDAFQFDQPALLGIERHAAEFGGRVSYYAPVDIQKVMATGDRALIEAEARRMIEAFKPLKGGLIIRDYSNYADIGVDESCAQWARNVFLCEGLYR